MDHDFGGQIAWRPTAADIERSHLHDFMRRHGIDSFDVLMHRSTADVAWFTQALFDFLGIEFQAPYRSVVDLSQGLLETIHWIRSHLSRYRPANYQV